MYKYLCLFFLSVLIISCSKKKSDNSESSDNDEGNIQQSTYSVENHRQSYHFKYPQCDTTHQIIYATSRKELKNKLCSLLQDHEANFGCAEEDRKNMFENKCVGMKWSPVYKEDKKENLNQNKNDQQDIIPEISKEKLISYLNNIVSIDIEMNQSLKFSNKKIANKLASSYLECNADFYGPLCREQGFHQYGLQYYSQKDEINGQTVLITATEYNAIKKNYMVVYYFNLSNQNQPLEKIQIYKMKKRYNYGTHLKNAINDPKYATQLITAKIATNPIQILQEKIQKSNNIKEIYFSYTVIDKLSFKKYRKKEYLENKEKMLSLLKGKSNTILESKDFATVTNLLNYIIQDYLGYSLKQDLNQLFENLSNSEDEQVKKYASTFLYYQDPSRVELKKEVLQALDISYSSIRYLAIKAIVKSDLSIEDLSKVFNLLTDGNSNVREMVMNKISQMTLEEAHLNILANLSKKELDWDVREFLTKKLGKTKNPLAKKMLIAKLNDTSSLIREEVYEALYEKELVENDLVYLRPLINAKEWDTRKYCLQLITKISGELASIDLAKGLQDKSQLIRDLVYDSLNERKITEKVVSELYYLFYHNEYDVRSKVIQLASKSNLERISEILIEKLDDPSQSIRELAYKLVAARELNTEHIAFIKRKITSKKWDTRNFSIQLMGMINDDTNSNESSVLLILALNDPSQMLRELAFDFLKTRKLQNDSDILSALESMLYKKNNWDSRKFSAIILSKIVSKESLAILEARLPLETSTIIQDEIQNSINLITSEISQI